MSPEQVRGEEADHRSDIFAFGCVLYEMLSSRRAFRKETAAETMTAILKEEPEDFTEVNAKINPALEKIVRRCLEKKPELRFQSTSDLGFALEALTTLSSSRLEATAHSRATSQTAGTRWLWKWGVFALATVALVLIGWFAAQLRPASSDLRVTWLEIGPPHQQFAVHPAPAISPDGRRIAFWAPDQTGKIGLWVRAFDSPAARLLPGTTTEAHRGVAPFWSPDGRSLGFFAERKLKRIDLAGGTPLSLADAPTPRGGSWGAGGIILFVPASGRGLFHVSASGGEATPLSLSLAPLQSSLSGYAHWPHFLPDGRHFLVAFRARGIYLTSLDAKEARQLSKVDSRAEYAGGYIFFGQNGSLFAQPFDHEQLTLSGEPFRIAENLGFSHADLSACAFSVSPHGTLVFWSGPYQPMTELTWFSRDGQRLATVGEPGHYMGFALSPTGQQVVVERHDPKINEMNLWLIDTTTGVGSKFAAGFSQAQWKVGTPVWSPKGDRVLFATFPGLAAQSLRGGEPEKLFDDFGHLMDISPDGLYALCKRSDPVTGDDLWLFSLTGEKTRKTWVATKHGEWAGRFSPDGRWVAYASDESGRHEVYVQSFPELSRPVRVSSNGGDRPEWGDNGNELYYLAPDGKLMASTVNRAGPVFQSLSPQPLFTINTSDEYLRRQYQASADGTRFLVNVQLEDTTPRVLTVVQNWPAAVKR